MSLGPDSLSWQIAPFVQEILTTYNPYVIGESAERHGIVTPRLGSARYSRDNNGVLAGLSLAQLYDRGRIVAVFASHPPGDVEYHEDLMKSIIGEWEIETGQSKENFRLIFWRSILEVR